MSWRIAGYSVMRALILSVSEPIEVLKDSVLLRGRFRLVKIGYWGNDFEELLLTPNIPVLLSLAWLPWEIYMSIFSLPGYSAETKPIAIWQTSHWNCETKYIFHPPGYCTISDLGLVHNFLKLIFYQNLWAMCFTEVALFKYWVFSLVIFPTYCNTESEKQGLNKNKQDQWWAWLKCTGSFTDSCSFQRTCKDHILFKVLSPIGLFYYYLLVFVSFRTTRFFSGVLWNSLLGLLHIIDKTVTTITSKSFQMFCEEEFLNDSVSLQSGMLIFFVTKPPSLSSEGPSLA